ncbi:MAG: hypothetical protein PUF10_08885 [Bacteroidales bacterium]|nr:hypothetical protein [Bacteroidales bacterium]
MIRISLFSKIYSFFCSPLGAIAGLCGVLLPLSLLVDVGREPCEFVLGSREEELYDDEELFWESREEELYVLELELVLGFGL